MTAPAKTNEAAATAALEKALRAAVDGGLAHLRRTDPDAASDMDVLRRREQTVPSVVVVGETKRGKSSLTNALIGVPNLSPVDAAVATSSYLEFVHGPQPGARAYIPGREDPVPLRMEDVRDYGTVLGNLPDGIRPPRRLEIFHPAPMLQYATLMDTPGVGGLDSLHAEVALDAVERATALLFVIDASAPFSQPELNFLIEASKRVNMVLFALTKIDAYPGWRTILDDDRSLLRAHAPRFANAPFFPVSSRLAELALRMPKEAAAEVVKESRVAELQHGLIGLAAKGTALKTANTLRAVRTEFVRLDISVGDRMKSADPDPALVERLKEERAKVNSRKRSETKQWSLALNTETQRARVEAQSRLRQYMTKLQEDFTKAIEKGTNSKQLPYEVDRALYAVSVRLSHELEHRFRVIGQRILASVFTPQELNYVLRRLNAQLRHALASKPQKESGGDSSMVVVASVGSAVSMGRLAMTGGTAAASALGAAAVGGVVVPVIGVGVGLAIGAFMMWKRKGQANKQQAKTWLREVLGEARASLSDDIATRFTDLQYALTLALDEAIERRLKQLDAQIAEIDKTMVEDKTSRQKKRADLQKEREALRARIKQLDEVLIKARAIAPSAPSDTQGG
ncbi:MAG TPA: dynamin family protein [Actinocatenispora sp.]